jgi:spore germination protein (amino acid permease)
VICFYIVFLAAGTLRETLVWTEATYLPETSRLFTIPVVLLLCFCLANSNLQTMVMTNIFVLSAVIVLGFFVSFANFQFKDFTLLRPVLEHGFGPVWSGMIFQLSGFIEIIIFIFMQHKIYDRFRFKHLAINVGIFVWLTLGPITGYITEFGPTEASKQMYPAFEQWAIVSIGKFIEHLDFFSIYQWLSGNFIRVSFFLFISLETFRFKSKKNRTWVLAFFCLLIMGFQLIPVNNPAYYQLEKELFIPVTFWLFFSVSILLGVLVFIFSKKPKEQQHVREKE